MDFEINDSPKKKTPKKIKLQDPGISLEKLEEIKNLNSNVESFENRFKKKFESKKKEIFLKEDLPQDQFVNMPGEDILESPVSGPIDTSWKGKISYELKDEVAVDFNAKLVHINGPKIEEYIPLLLKIENRLSLEELLKYIPDIDQSNTRYATVGYFLPEESTLNDDYNKLFLYLKKVNRGGVFTIPSHPLFTELFVFPLSKSDILPTFINANEYNREYEDTLIGIFISKTTSKKRKFKNDSNLKGIKKQKLNNDSINEVGDEKKETNFEENLIT